MKVLGIETSCDETAVALFDSEQGLLADALYSQIDLHAEYGGVVPELASRDHVKQLVPLTKKICPDLSQIDAVAYTAGPGLVGALLVGASFGRSLAYGLGVPAVEVHHMEGHLLAPMLEENRPAFPFVALLVSGGHTQLIAVNAVGDYTLLGDTVDDAAGEAFDKTAKLLELGYPGGPAIAKLAKQGDVSRFDFPRPMINRPGCDFSFSGLKTFVRNTYEQNQNEPNVKADVAAAFQEAVVDTLRRKCERALEQTGFSRLVVAGGVSANEALRVRLEKLMLERKGQAYFPRPDFCTDNGAMIAYAGCQRLLAGERAPLAIRARPRWPLVSTKASYSRSGERE